MIAYILGCWMFGLVWVGVLSALSPSELGWVAMLGRAAYALGVGVVLVITAVIVGSSTDYAALAPSEEGLWAYAVGAALPVTLLAFLVVRPTLPHPLLVAVATLPAMGFVLASPAAFRPWGKELDGLALVAHRHHSLVVAAIAVSVVIVAAALAAPNREGATAPASS